MKTIHLKSSWIIKAPRNSIYNIVSDFESMPKNFPAVAHSMKIISKNGNNLVIEAVAKSFGTPPDSCNYEYNTYSGKRLYLKQHQPCI